MAIDDIVRQIFVRLRDLTDRVLDLESDGNSIMGFHYSNAFPSSPHPNQVVIRTDETPPQGGAMYRYDNATNTWMRLN